MNDRTRAAELAEKIEYPTSWTNGTVIRGEDVVLARRALRCFAGQTTALADINAERQRQIAKGYDAGHDDTHAAGAILWRDWGALARIGPHAVRAHREGRMDDYRRLLVEAAAQVIAEIERLDRNLPETAVQEVVDG